VKKITALLNKIKAQRNAESIPLGYRSKYTRYIAMAFAVLLCLSVAIAFWSSFSKSDGKGESITYPLEKDISEYNPYVQQFDAIKKGQLHIDYTPSDRFLAVEDPYEPSERYNKYGQLKAKEFSTFWDRAYFDGKFYSYFGMAPILTVIFPAQLITGSIPAETTIQLIFMLIFAIFAPLAIYALGERIAKRTNPFLIALVSAVSALSSLQLLLGRGRNPFYYIAATAAMAFLAIFSFLFIKGIFSEKKISRCVWFTLAGLSFALCMHSRINTAFTAAFVILPAIIFGIILKKREKRKGEGISFFKRNRVDEIALELSSLASFVIIGAIALFALNHARFGSIFEFGTKYQITVANVSSYKLNIGELGNSIFHYFIAPLKTSTETEALNFAYWSLGDIGRYIYIDAHFGILNIPFNFFALAIPFFFADKEKNISLKVIPLCAIFGCVVSAWIDYCLGGVIYRYLCDFSFIWSAVAAVGLFLIFDKLSHTKYIATDAIISTVLLAFLIVSAIFTLDVMAISNINLLNMDSNSLFSKLFGPKRT